MAAAVLPGADRDDRAGRRPSAGDRLYRVIAADAADQQRHPDADEDRDLQIAGPAGHRGAGKPEEPRAELGTHRTIAPCWVSNVSAHRPSSFQLSVVAERR
jgi:hypothetical protein